MFAHIDFTKNTEQFCEESLKSDKAIVRKSSDTTYALADPGGGGADPWFFYAQNANFSQFFFRSRLILSIILIEIWPKHAKKDFTSTSTTL